MKMRHIALVLGSVLFAWSASVAADGGKKVDIGQREYQDHCVVCHGVTAKGDGPLGEVLKVRVPDLSLLSKSNGGVFPFARVYESIDGRQQVAAHGTRDMLVWGNAYKWFGIPEHDDYTFDREAFVRSRILSLIDYLHRMQVK